jgi:hypothetical protein
VRLGYRVGSSFVESDTAKRSLLALLLPIKWLSSVKDDLSFEENRPVNPVPLIAKLLVVVGMSVFAIVATLKMFR